MNRIEQTFADLRRKKEKALIAYVTAGDPSLEKTGDIITGLAGAGVDILEIGVPFSDPTADGPVIQAASQRALRSGTTLKDILNMIGSIRADLSVPIVLFGYYNPILQYGPRRFADDAGAAGVDGLLVVDLPPEEYAELRTCTDQAGIDFISLIAPTTTTDRMKLIARRAAGFLYFVSITGVTGTAEPRPSDVAVELARIRSVTAMPVAVGFGISTPEQAESIAPYADGIVVGSAFVRLIERYGGRDSLVSILATRARGIKEALIGV